MSKSGISGGKRSFDIGKVLIESAKNAVSKACIDTEAIAKEEIGKQVYSTIETVNYKRTGAARASIYTVTPYDSNFEEAKSNVKLLNPKADTYEAPVLNQTKTHAEGVVGCAVNYGTHIENGSVFKRVSIPPRPFMTPASERVAPKFKKICGEMLDASIVKQTKKVRLTG